MAKLPPNPSLAEVIKEIEGGIEEYRLAASELTTRICTFETWLNKLPGKVPAFLWHDLSEDTDIGFILQLKRKGKEWALYHSTEHAYDDVIIDHGGLLRDADVETKARAIRLFPELLSAIRKAQIKFVKESTKAARDFDEFARSIGIEEVN